MKQINKKIEKQYEMVRQIAVDEMIRLARKVLKEHPHLDECVIAMGTFFFTYKDEEKRNSYHNTLDLRESYMGVDYSYYYRPARLYLVPIVEFLDKWNDVFKLTGEGIRFRVEGEIITDW